MAEENKHFWSTIPGILTGVAAVITALTGMFAILKNNTPAAPPSSGGGSGSQGSPSVTPPATPPVAPPASPPVTPQLTAPATPPNPPPAGTPASPTTPATPPVAGGSPDSGSGGFRPRIPNFNGAVEAAPSPRVTLPLRDHLAPAVSVRDLIARDVFVLSAVINDRDGFTNVRSGKDGNSEVVAQVKRGEVFKTYRQDGSWWQVRTSEGKVGYMHLSRIKLVE